ncbi:MAG: HD domain-containing protein [Actinobacteria bacterium]|nr:HD domain-containing protein [Actinomycetota bacterium]
MTASLSMHLLVRDAQTLAHTLLSGDPRRLAHVRGAALIAGMAAGALRVDQPETLVAAAWLHDIGYAPSLRRTGFHPLDGAMFLARKGWPDSVVLLVAHHSHAAVLAPYYGVHHHMSLLDHAPGNGDDIITFSDLRAGTNGMGADPRDRIDDMRRRHADRTFVPSDIREARYRMMLTAAARVNAAINGATRAQPTLMRQPPRAS